MDRWSKNGFWLWVMFYCVVLGHVTIVVGRLSEVLTCREGWPDSKWRLCLAEMNYQMNFNSYNCKQAKACMLYSNMYVFKNRQQYWWLNQYAILHELLAGFTAKSSPCELVRFCSFLSLLLVSVTASPQHVIAVWLQYYGLHDASLTVKYVATLF